MVSVLGSGSDGPGSSPGWGMTLCPCHIASSSRIGRKTVGPVSCRVGVGDVNFPTHEITVWWMSSPGVGWVEETLIVKRL